MPFSMELTNVLNLELEFANLFSFMHSTAPVDVIETLNILAEIIVKIKRLCPSTENILNILGTDNGKLLQCI